MGLILVVEDHEDTAYVLLKMLKQWGHDTISAGTGEAGLALLADQKPDLIIVDGMMPGMNGVEFIRLIRAGAATSMIPAILYTAVADPAFTDNALEKGANEIWIKGLVEMDQMKARIDHYLH
jgi:CheY-like chemotaxis protein